LPELFERTTRYNMGIQVVVHRIAEDGSSVLTERIDALTAGPFRAQFWVCGVFEVHDGQVTLWRNHFDWRDVLLATMRGILGVVFLRPEPSFPTLGRRGLAAALRDPGVCIGRKRVVVSSRPAQWYS
jgi:hypothetical protein